MSISFWLFFQLILTHKHYFNDNETCTICLKIVKLIRDTLNDTNVRKYLKDAAENICSALPPEIFSYCLAYIDKKVASHFDQFVKDLDPNTTCKYLEICPNSTNTLNKVFLVHVLISYKKSNFSKTSTFFQILTPLSQFLPILKSSLYTKNNQMPVKKC